MLIRINNDDDVHEASCHDNNTMIDENNPQIKNKHDDDENDACF